LRAAELEERKGAAMIVRRVGPMSLGKLLGAIYGTIGLIAGSVFALFSLLGAGIGSMIGGEEAVASWVAGLLGVGAVVFLPLFYGGIGFFAGLLSAVFYNMFAGMVGGIRVDLE
jgi:hypothetical protein